MNVRSAGIMRSIETRARRSSIRGDGMVSYLIILALVVLVCVGAATGLGREIVVLIEGDQGAGRGGAIPSVGKMNSRIKMPKQRTDGTWEIEDEESEGEGE